MRDKDAAGRWNGLYRWAFSDPGGRIVAVGPGRYRTPKAAGWAGERAAVAMTVWMTRRVIERAGAAGGETPVGMEEGQNQGDGRPTPPDATGGR